MTLILFEDETWRHFATIAQARPIFDLRAGAFTARERVAAVVGPEAVPLGMCRSHLMRHFGAQGGLPSFLSEDRLVLINGRALDLSWLPDLLTAPTDTVYLAGDSLLGATLSTALASIILYYLQAQAVGEAVAELRRFARIKELGDDAPPLLLNYPWDLISEAGEQLIRDLPLLTARIPAIATDDPQIVVRGEHVYIGPEARLDGPVVLDARDGPIFIENGAHIEPFSYIQGPTYIGTKTLIASARIRGETSLGPVCRIGGEVEASTIQGYSNKHHDGFLGHSWLGEWVNIGAMTTNSDLKNNYGNVRVVLEGIGQIDSQVMKLGCFLADHVKLGIGLHLIGGTMIGTGSNVFSVHTAPKNVPHFTWGSDVFREYRIDGMINVARKVMARRKRELTPSYEQLLRDAFDITRSSRNDMAEPPPIPRLPGSEQSRAGAEAALKTTVNE
jgi:UDP-N-acetylglucosamine diphosphorylase/glucosamine-1-phosphate N-acetyltransferase